MGTNFVKRTFNNVILSAESQCIFVADLFVQDYVGGAELSMQALINSAPFKVDSLQSHLLSIEILHKYKNKHWIFCNYTNLDPTLLAFVAQNINYSIVEFDYKFCKFRSCELHEFNEGKKCDCNTTKHGIMISEFMKFASKIWWMSCKQREIYFTLFPQLRNVESEVLSSVFDPQFFGEIERLNATFASDSNEFIVLDSKSWIKGTSHAIKWCVENKKKFKTVSGKTPNEFLKLLKSSAGLVYLPCGNDTCPRMIIEAKLLGKEVITNEYVQHMNEEWFTAENDATLAYLQGSTSRFWTSTRSMINSTISGYTTTMNCESQQYPFIQSIKSMMQFCDEVCVVDGGSTDDTLIKLAQLAYPRIVRTSIDGLLKFDRTKDQCIFDFPDEIDGYKRDQRIKVRVIVRDWSHPRYALFDGMQKAEARKMCTSKFCWQQDSDEVVHEMFFDKIITMIKNFPKNALIVSLPVIEYWGGPEKVRLDVEPWKWRISRNLPFCTHGVPKSLRRYDENNEMFAAPGTDGCDMIHAESGEQLPNISFYTKEAAQLRTMALLGDEKSLREYEGWFNIVINSVPAVHHYSWYDLQRKIRLYKNYWTKHWLNLMNRSTDDTAENNMMFDCAWKDVTDEMISERACEMKEKLGGWIWHRKWNGKVRTPHIKITLTEPDIMQRREEA